MSDEELIALLREKAAKGEGFYARYAPPAVTVRVKPLVWRDEFMRWSGNSFTSTAVGAGHTYIIAASLDDPEAENVIAAKKAAAQADYEARILAALEPVAAPDPAAIREAALREAVDCCTYVIKNMAILKADGETYETPRVQKIARGLVDVARQDILALIQKGGDALDQAVPIDARPATSPGVTAGAISKGAADDR